MREIGRQIIHSLGILTILPIIWWGREVAALITLVLVLIFLFLAYSKILKFYKVFERPKESLDGAITFYISSLLVILAFPPTSAIAGIAVLAIADSISTLVGSYFGKNKLWINKKKSWEGSIAFYLSSLFVLSFFANPIVIIIVAALTTFVEMLPKINDNLTIPIAVALFLEILKYL